MRTLDSIRAEMASVAGDYKAAEAADVREAMDRLHGWYDALASVLQEDWKEDAA